MKDIEEEQSTDDIQDTHLWCNLYLGEKDILHMNSQVGHIFVQICTNHTSLVNDIRIRGDPSMLDMWTMMACIYIQLHTNDMNYCLL